MQILGAYYSCYFYFQIHFLSVIITPWQNKYSFFNVNNTFDSRALKNNHLISIKTTSRASIHKLVS